MRNFKKFLALVLAMLMVSACAVSVSAAYSDQDAVDATGYAEAVAALGTLGVMQGSGDGSFNPNGTLTRAEAAVITAKLVAGAKGQSYDWTANTCQFPDVTASWSFAYINYVAQRNIMQGDGTGKFNPNGTLQVDEALALAVKALSATKTAEVVKNNETYKPAYWATYWISAAEELGLAPADIFSYTEPCSRAMMAQIGYNMLSANIKDANGDPLPNKIKDGFGLTTVTSEIVKVTDVVELKNRSKIKTDAFNDALKAAGVELTAADLKNCKVTLTYSSKSNSIYGVTVDTAVTVYTYADAKIANVKDSAGALTDKITVDGIEYVVNGSDSTDTGIIGGSTSTKGIDVKVDGASFATKTALPTYYKALACDDDGDGDCDRLIINTYKIATVKVVETNSKGVVIYEVSTGFTNNKESVDDEKPVTWTGAAVVTDNVTPMLVSNVIDLNDAGNAYVADVLEVAGTVSGKLVGIGSNYVNIDGNKYTNVEDAVAPAAEYLNQNATIYTIGGQYVKVASAASKTEIEVVVNSAVVKDGKAVVTGYNKSSAYADITITVDGIKDSKLVAKVANQNTKKDSEGKDYNTTVSLGYMDGTTFKPEFTFDEGLIIKLTQTDTGVYVDKTSDTTIANFGTEFEFGTPSEKKLAVKDGYVYVDGVAQKYFVSGSIILEEVVKSDAKDGAYDKISYNKLTAYPEQKNVKCDFKYEDTEKTKVNFIYVSEHSAVSTKTTYKNLAEGQAIVYIKDASVVEATYDKSIYNAVNLFTGEKIQITHTGSVEAGHYYIINAEKSVVEDTTSKWIGNYVVNVEYSGLVGVVKAQPVVKIVDSTPNTKPEYKQDGDVLAFGLDNITVYNAGVLDKDGNVSKADVSKTLMTGTSHTVNGTASTDAVKGDIYVVAGQMIIVLK